MANAVFAKNVYVYIDGYKINKILADGIPEPEVSDEEIDATTMDSGDWEETIAGRKTGGTVTIRCLHDPDNQGATDGQGALENAWAENPKQNHTFTIVKANMKTISFEGWVKTFQNPIIDKKIGIAATIRVTGSVTRALTAAALTTPYFSVKNAVTDAAITDIIPAPAATGGTYVVSVPAATGSVKITPTSTSGTITVDGTAVATGVASGAITLGDADTVTEVVVKVTETAKLPVFYRLLFARAAT
jgi:hypothetical protein